MNIEQLLNKLEQETRDQGYHRFSSKNEILEKECDYKIFLVKICIMEKIEILKDTCSNLITNKN